MSKQPMDFTWMSKAMNKMESSTNHKREHKSKRITPHIRQDLLMERLLVGLQSSDANEVHERRRPYSSTVSDAAVSVSSITSIVNTNRSNDSPMAIDILSTWKEISNLFPLLSYGEESKQLMLTLMGIHPEHKDLTDEMLLNGLGEVIVDMLRVRRHLMHNVKEQQVAKKQKISSTQSTAISAASKEIVETAEAEVLPWNVLLRVAMRFTAFTCKHIHSRRDAKSVSFKDDKFNDRDRHSSCLKSSEDQTEEETAQQLEGAATLSLKSSHNQSEARQTAKIADGSSSAAASSIVTSASTASIDSQPANSVEPVTITSSTNSNKNTSSVLDVDNMQYNDIRSELSARGMNCNGKLHQLKQRLKEALISQPCTYNSPIGSAPENDYGVESMSYNDIRSELSNRGMDVTGKLNQLKQRLKQARARDQPSKTLSISEVDTLDFYEIKRELKRRNVDLGQSCARSESSLRLKLCIDPNYKETGLNVDSLGREELKRELQERNLSYQGTRTAMVERLKRAIGSNSSAASTKRLDVDSMSMDEIKRELQKRGLACHGSRYLIAERLQDAFVMDSNLEMMREKYGVICVHFDDLKSELNKRGLDRKGKKPELVARLLSHLEREKTLQSIQESTLVDTTESVSSSNHKSSASAKEENPEVETKDSHPILQSLDIVISELNIMLRTEQRRFLEEKQRVQNATESKMKNEASGHANRKRRMTAILGGRNESGSTSITQQQPLNSGSFVANDRMICDWKNRSWSGPSRYTFLKDVEFIVSSFDLEALTISVEEFKEKADAIVRYLDEYVGFETSEISTPMKRYPASKSQPPVGSSPTGSLLVASPMSSPFRRSPMSSSGLSFAETTRVRVIRAIEIQKEMRRQTISPASKAVRCHGEVTLPAETSDGTDFIGDDDTGRLKDSYRMAIAFSNGQNEGCAMLKRRLELLARHANDSKGKKPEIVGAADSYLRLLLRELLLPSDPVSWAALLKESKGRETPMLLRKGRAALSSFLIEIQAPGWDGEHGLDPSPLADYLGFLSDRGDMPTNNQHRHTILAYSSFLLPHNEATSMPPPPVVTDIGLGSCIVNYLEKEDESNIGIDFIFHKKALLNQTDTSLESIKLALPDVSQLTRDLFDLILRLAANDDREHEKKPFPLRLAMSSASECLKVVLNVVEDNRHWLQPRAISARYQVVTEMIMASFNGINDHGLIGASDDNETSWALRASSLIKIAKTVQNRARIALYATQFMTTLCDSEQVGAASLYDCLHLQKFKQFWKELENASTDAPTSEMSRVFDFAFCTKHILPLAHHCSAFLVRQSRFPAVADDVFSVNEEAERVLHLIALLCSMFRLIHENGHLVDCVHVGCSVEVLAFSIGFFVQCKAFCSINRCPWHQVHSQLTKLYEDAWGCSQLDFKEHPSYNSSNKSSFIMIDCEHGAGTRCSLMPSFGSLVASLVSFVCRHKTAEGNEEWCQFAASCLLGRYAPVLPLNAVAPSWIKSLVSILRNEVIRHKVLECGKHDNDTDSLLAQLMNPMLKRLHCAVVGQCAFGMEPVLSNTEDITTIACVFSKLYEEESSKILTRPSQTKTRKWHVYRYCIEAVFVITPPKALFTSLDCSCLIEPSTGALRQVCRHFGQSHLRLIMIAAALAVNESLRIMQYTCSATIRAICDAFTVQAKECINEYHAPDICQETHNFHDFVHDVRRHLQWASAHHGLMWWNEMTSSIGPILVDGKKTKTDQASESTKRSGNVASILTCFEESITALSGSK